MGLDVKNNAVNTGGGSAKFKASIEEEFKIGNGSQSADKTTNTNTDTGGTNKTPSLDSVKGDIAKLASDLKAFSDQLGKGATGGADKAGATGGADKAGAAGGDNKAGGADQAAQGGDQGGGKGGGLKDLLGGLFKMFMPMLQQLLGGGLGGLLGGLGIPGL